MQNYVDKFHQNYINATSAATRTGDWVDATNVGSVTFHASIATNVDSAGTFDVEIYNEASEAAVNYNSQTVTAGVVFTHVWEISPVVSRKYRLKFTRTAGTSDAILARYVTRKG